MATTRFVVRGRVQGVGYRYFALKEAEALGLTGFARNAADGSVEVVAEGNDDALRRFGERLREGPAFAAVEGVEASSIDERGDSRFEVR